MCCGKPLSKANRVKCEVKRESIVHITCCEVQHVSGLLSTRCFFPTDLSSVELTLADNKRVRISFHPSLGDHKDRDLIIVSVASKGSSSSAIMGRK